MSCRRIPLARLLTAAVATAAPDGDVDLGWIRARTPWAVDVAMALRLPLHLDGSLCTNGRLGPMTSYLPNGAYG